MFNFKWLHAFKAAWRENRKRDQQVRDQLHNLRNQATGLNGLRAVERRKRQIARGQLTASNGLRG